MSRHTRAGWSAAVAMLIVVPIAAAQAPAPAAPAGRGAQPPLRGGYTEAGTLPVRIMEFKVDRASIKPGETITLTWAVENPRGDEPVTIAPGIGRVAPLASLKVTPKQTMTYTLTATGITGRGADGALVNGALTRTVTVTVAGTQPLAAAPAAATAATARAAVPRTLDGKPDLSGVYGYAVQQGRGGGAAPAAGAPADGLPTTPTVKDPKFRVQRGPTDTGLYASCRPPGVPQTYFVPYYLQIIQSPKHVVILHEYLTLPRVILMDEELPEDPDPFYMGHSVGRWEGDTLVVRSKGFKESEIRGFRTTEALTLVERFRRPTANTLELEVIIEDANAFTGPWRILTSFPHLPEYKRIDEFFCENNRDYKPLFGQ